MKFLIIGKNSYIGNHIDDWLSKKEHQVEQLDVLTDAWQSFDYSSYDVVVHVAGIVHRPDCTDWNLYKSVNMDMPVAIAGMYKKARRSNGLNGSYIYFSTMGVFDAVKSLKGCVVDEHTPIRIDGNSMYGKSKALAELELQKLQDTNFNVAFVRPPSVYGKNCRGGYIAGFTSVVHRLPILPRAYQHARQSFIYIDNLCECVRIIAEKHLSGVFCPQDDETPNANELFAAIAAGLGKEYYDNRLLGLLMQMVSFIPLVKKAFGGIEYARSMSEIKGVNYVVVPFKEGMKRTVR